MSAKTVKNLEEVNGSRAKASSIFLNEDFDRSTVIVGRTNDGTLEATASFTVTQLGLRESFTCSDGEEFLTEEDENFGVLKE